jgi:hypothetical protein
MITMLVPNDKLEAVKAKLNALEDFNVEEKNTTEEFFDEFTKELLIQESIEALKQLGTLLATVAL